MQHRPLPLIAGLLAIAAGPLAQAQGQDFSTVEITATQLTDTLYMLQGRGGNIGVSAGADGVFIIDDQYAPLSDKIRAAIGEISKQPIRFVINTHWHSDHTGGNENFGQGGSVIIAHDNVRRRLAADQVMEFFKSEVKAAPPIALPMITFNDELSLHLNGDEARIIHAARAHTDGDAIIHFVNSNVYHFGDTFFNGMYPFIDLDSGGSLHGMIMASGMLLGECNEATKIIPGHGPLAGRAELADYHAMLIGVRDAVRPFVAGGKTLEETIAAKPTAAYDEKWGQGFIKPDAMVTFAYRSIEKQRAERQTRRDQKRDNRRSQ